MSCVFDFGNRLCRSFTKDSIYHTWPLLSQRGDRHRGGGHPPTPATPPCVRVRTRRFETVTLTVLEQGRKSQRFEVRIRKPHSQGFSLREIPRAATAAGGIARQSLSHPQYHQSRPATARCFPLPPQSRPESQPDPAL